MGIRPRCSSRELEGAVNKGPWSSVEDKVLIDYIRVHGVGRWAKLPKRAGLNRSGKSCRLRWLNYLRPDIKRGNITLEEEDLIIRLHKLLGNRWSLIAGRIPGRTDNEIKNYWNTVLKKKTEQQQQEDQQRDVNSFLNSQVSKPAPKSPAGDLEGSSPGRCRRSQLPEETTRADDHLRVREAVPSDDLALLVHGSTSAAPEQCGHDQCHNSLQGLHGVDHELLFSNRVLDLHEFLQFHGHNNNNNNNNNNSSLLTLDDLDQYYCCYW